LSAGKIKTSPIIFDFIKAMNSLKHLAPAMFGLIFSVHAIAQSALGKCFRRFATVCNAMKPQ